MTVELTRLVSRTPLSLPYVMIAVDEGQFLKAAGVLRIVHMQSVPARGDAG